MRKKILKGVVLSAKRTWKNFYKRKQPEATENLPWADVSQMWSHKERVRGNKGV